MVTGSMLRAEELGLRIRRIVGLALFLIAPLARAQSVREAKAAAVDAIFAPLAGAMSPGVAVVVRKDSRIVFERGYGARELRDFAKIDARTNFRLASCSKQFTAMAIMLLAHDGKLRYEDRLSRETTNPEDSRRLSEHLTLARDGALPIRMVVTSRTEENSTGPRSFYVRPDLTGKVVKFDGDHFIVDFTRPEETTEAVSAVRRR